MARDRNEAINSYITDMLALEDHIEKAIRSQIEDLKDYPEVVAELRQLHRKIEHHIADLRGLSDRRQSGATGAGPDAAGAAVGAVSGRRVRATAQRAPSHAPNVLATRSAAVGARPCV